MHLYALKNCPIFSDTALKCHFIPYANKGMQRKEMCICMKIQFPVINNFTGPTVMVPPSLVLIATLSVVNKEGDAVCIVIPSYPLALSVFLVSLWSRVSRQT